MDTSICFNTFALFFVSTLYFSNEANSSPILNSELACESKFGYHASIELFNCSICGGAIIDDRYVVTAAHCLINKQNEFNGDPLKVVVGTVDLNIESQHKVSVDVEQAYIPVEFDVRRNKTKRMIGDIAVLKLKTDLGIKAHKYLRKLKLPTNDKPYNDKEVVVSGFGFIELVKREKSRGEGCGIRDNKLHYSKARVIALDECQRILSKKPVTSKHLCAACLQLDPDNPTGVCDGDSGGPLVYKNNQLIGIVSTSPKHCREDRLPAVYTKVWPFVDFIKKVKRGRIDENIRNITLIPQNSCQLL